MAHWKACPQGSETADRLIDSDLDIDWGRTERITEHLLGLLAELHPVEKWNLGPFCDSVGIGVDALEVKS